MGNNFRTYVTKEMNKRGWSPSDLARAAGVAKSTISMNLNDNRQPGTILCNGIARAFGVPPEEIYRLAGILPSEPKTNQTIEKINHTVSGLPPEEQVNVLEYALLRRRLAEERGTYHDPQTAKQSTAGADG